MLVPFEYFTVRVAAFTDIATGRSIARRSDCVVDCMDLKQMLLDENQIWRTHPEDWKGNEAGTIEHPRWLARAFILYLGRAEKVLLTIRLPRELTQSVAP